MQTDRRQPASPVAGPGEGHRLGPEAARRAAETVDLVHTTVRWVCRSWPQHVDRHELVSAGMLGLVQAAERWDESSGVPFRSFAAWRVRGAVLDAARSLDPVGRAARTRLRAVEEARDHLRERLGREPTAGELAAASGIGVDELDALARRARAARPLRLDLDDPARGDGLPLPDPAALDPLDTVERADLRELVREALEWLPERHRFVVVAIHLEGRSSQEVARLLGVTPSRVSQLHHQALQRLRERLAAREVVGAG